MTESVAKDFPRPGHGYTADLLQTWSETHRTSTETAEVTASFHAQDGNSLASSLAAALWITSGLTREALGLDRFFSGRLTGENRVGGDGPARSQAEDVPALASFHRDGPARASPGAPRPIVAVVRS